MLLEMVEPLGTAQHPLSPKIEKFLHSPKVGGAQGGRCHRAASPTTQGTVRTTSQLPLPPPPRAGVSSPPRCRYGITHPRTPLPWKRRSAAIPAKITHETGCCIFAWAIFGAACLPLLPPLTACCQGEV